MLKRTKFKSIIRADSSIAGLKLKFLKWSNRHVRTRTQI